MVIKEDSSNNQFSSVQPDLETQSFAHDDVEPIMLDDNLIQKKGATSVEDYDPIDDAEQYDDFIDEYENDEPNLDNDDSQDGASEDHSDDDDGGPTPVLQVGGLAKSTYVEQPELPMA
ncbi:Uncharacterized protein Fot_24815 [Forsythia ovata]|uniref:Uncharacterized protein n=1 Tax=Forsythia ovata TaxID=205694 RepID=A0ABD1U7F3_9LAMI